MKRLFGNSQGAHVATDLLSAYLDGQVTAAERDRVDAHVRQCASCQSELDSLRRTIMLLQALPRVSVPRAFTLSEVQVGIRRPGAQPAWLGGLIRGLGAVTAVALVALMAATLLRTPTAQVARVVPASQAPSAEPPTAVMEAPAVAAPAEETAPVVAMAPSVAPTEVRVEQQQAAPPTAELALAMAAPTEAETRPTVEEPPQAKAAAPEVVMEASEAPTASPWPDEARETEVAPAFDLEEGRALADEAPGLGGGLEMGSAAVAGEAGQPSETLTPAVAPPLAPADTVLPEQAGLAFADGQVLTALDGASGMREVVAATGVHMPVISGSRSRIAYRVEGGGGLEVWATSWDGLDQTMLLSEDDLAAEGYAERRIQTLGWIPGQERLSVITTVYATADEVAPRQELWHVDAVSGEHTRILEMGQMGRVFYAPGGERFAVLEYGTPEQPEGSLTLYEGGGAGRVAVSFPVAPDTPAYASQVQWLSDGSALLFAAPEPGDAAAPTVSLYRVSANGDTQPLGSIPALEASWTADGSRLALLRPVEGSPDLRELVLARPDGSDPQSYAQLQNGEFLGWSPYGPEFLYSSAGLVYAGAPDRAPESPGNTLSLHDPRWVAPGQVLSLLDQGTGWMLVWRNLDSGEVASLAPLPKGISYDIVSPPAE
jgi:hypothetical protein